MTEYNAKDMRSKAGQMLDEARRGEEVVIMRRGAERFVLRYEPEGAYPSEHSGDVRVSTIGGEDLLGQLISGQSQTNDLLRELIEQNRDTRHLDEIIEKSRPAEATRSTVTVQIPERVEDPKPELPGEPTQDELRTAQEYFGLREVPDGLEVTQKGIQSALAHMKKASRGKPDSVEAQVISMDPASEDRMECIRLYQIDRYSKALAKRAAGDPKWLGMASPRI